MAANGKPGDSRRHGAIKKRSQLKNPKTKLWIKRDDKTGRFMDNKTTGGKFKGVRAEK